MKLDEIKDLRRFLAVVIRHLTSHVDEMKNYDVDFWFNKLNEYEVTKRCYCSQPDCLTLDLEKINGEPENFESFAAFDFTNYGYMVVDFSDDRKGICVEILFKKNLAPNFLPDVINALPTIKDPKNDKRQIKGVKKCRLFNVEEFEKKLSHVSYVTIEVS